ncbi:heparan-alpha-glucosaminide N-acetyltransferase-like [Cucumis melo var. makuwa]|uniref:Heparan-alpha-glucosaminide N-acetyltransferase-like n=1 Tax=Cucumis melo var. makuwa TaxID=1194695 RepID=A0A5A7SY20_CUCMM|nr:heparan-alpha-glucosaminide N-acetyltransferase-like [Cucumis melo var. makuwa]
MPNLVVVKPPLEEIHHRCAHHHRKPTRAQSSSNPPPPLCSPLEGLSQPSPPPCSAVSITILVDTAESSKLFLDNIQGMEGLSFSTRDKGSIRDGTPSWCLALFELEGLLSSISAILSDTIGIHYGHVLLHSKFFVDSFSKAEAIAIPINKQLYRFSYFYFTVEAAGIVFSVQSFVYFIVVSSFIYTNRRLGFSKAILISRMDWNECNVGVCNGISGNFAAFINGWYYKDPENSLNDVATCCNWYWIIFSLKINDWENNQIATSTIMTIF